MSPVLTGSSSFLVTVDITRFKFMFEEKAVTRIAL